MKNLPSASGNGGRRTRLLLRSSAVTASCLALLVLSACGSDSSGSPTGIDNRPIPEGEPFYVSARVTVLDPFLPGPNDPTGSEQTTLPRDCDGNAVPAGTTWFLEGDALGGGLQFGAPRGGIPCDEPFGNPTFVTPAVGGTDRSLNMSVLLARMPVISNIENELLGQTMRSWGHTSFAAGFNLDPQCGGDAGDFDPNAMNFGTESNDCALWNGQGCSDSPRSNCGCDQFDPNCCTYGVGWNPNGDDEVVLNEFTLVQNECGDWIFEPGSPIGGTAFFTAQSQFLLGGSFAFARVEAEVCFRFPALDPPQDFEATGMAPCP